MLFMCYFYKLRNAKLQNSGGEIVQKATTWKTEAIQG